MAEEYQIYTCQKCGKTEKTDEAPDCCGQAMVLFEEAQDDVINTPRPTPSALSSDK
jgi:hypothetical protein